MSDEIEAKMKVPDFSAILQKLREQGATRKGSELETNIFFDTPDGALRMADKGMRIRIAINERGIKKCTVTFKGPLQKGPLKKREENEFVVSGPKAVSELFAQLGYHETLSFEKRRESWLFHECEVDLDELPFLGKYVEIEGPSEAKVMEARSALNLAETDIIKRGYISLLDEYVRTNNIKDHHLRL
jgi:predicted adenylyl cyclase CyaB